MKVIYVPVFRTPVSYIVSLGRRWSLLEQIILVELAKERRSVSDLAASTNVPERLIVEALINLLRAGWVEVRSMSDKALFAATPTGKRRSAEEELRPDLRRELRWTSLCMDRMTGSWIRSDDLDLVYERDLPENVNILTPIHGTLNYDDPGVRDLIYLKSNEGFESFQPMARAPARPYARVVIDYDGVERGLPPYASLRLRSSLLAAAKSFEDVRETYDYGVNEGDSGFDCLRDNLTSEDFVVGGPEHLVLIRSALEAAKTHIIIHSCFLHPETIKILLPDFEKAARRKVRIDLLWGLRADPEATEKPRAIGDVEQVLNTLTPLARQRVQLSPVSSASHCKVVLYDDAVTNRWVSVVGSCNYLSSQFDSIEISLRSRSVGLAAQLLSYLISAQLPSSGGWSPVARRLNRTWNLVRRNMGGTAESGQHRLILLSDEDHYACITMARDSAQRDILVGCDLFGLAAETSVLVPLQRAVELGRRASLFYQRPSKFLSEQGRSPDEQVIGERGMELIKVEKLHGKFLAWDDDAAAITSFNWLSTVADGTRTRGAELGILALGTGIRKMLEAKFALTPMEASLSRGRATGAEIR
jgi:hypothetical protein